MFDINSITLKDYTRLHARSDLTVEQERLLIKASFIHGKRWADEEAAARWLKANPKLGLSKDDEFLLKLKREYVEEQKSWKRHKKDFDDEQLF